VHLLMHILVTNEIYFTLLLPSLIFFSMHDLNVLWNILELTNPI
jgi:hypothetical protein